jgi:hypothetical protein
MRPTCGAFIFGCSNTSHSNAPPLHAASGIYVTNQPTCRGSLFGLRGEPVGRANRLRRRVGKRVGAGLLGEAGEQPDQLREKVRDQVKDWPRDAVPGGMRAGNPAQFLDEEGEAVGRVLGDSCHC